MSYMFDDVNERIKARRFYYCYAPKRFFNQKPFSQETRDLTHAVWDFKDGKNQGWVIDLVIEYIKAFHSNVKDLCLVCVPASTRLINQCRWENFSNTICKTLNISNGFEHITILKEKEPKHLTHQYTKGEYKYDYDFFKGKKIIVFDDLVTRGISMSTFVEEIKETGGTVIDTLSIARTIYFLSFSLFAHHPINNHHVYKYSNGYLHDTVSSLEEPRLSVGSSFAEEPIISACTKGIDVFLSSSPVGPSYTAKDNLIDPKKLGKKKDDVSIDAQHEILVTKNTSDLKEINEDPSLSMPCSCDETNDFNVSLDPVLSDIESNNEQSINPDDHTDTKTKKLNGFIRSFNKSKKRDEHNLKYKFDDDIKFVKFGRFNGRPISWIVLSEDDGNMLLLSKFALTHMPYNDVLELSTWDMCSLRKWLNNDFYFKCFNKEEQSFMVKHLVNADTVSEHELNPGDDVEDYVHILSFKEYLDYFSSIGRNLTWKCKLLPDMRLRQCWVRNYGADRFRAGFIGRSGTLHEGGSAVNSPRNAVRPVIVVKSNYAKKCKNI